MPVKKKDGRRNISQQKKQKANLKKINYNVSGIDFREIAFSFQSKKRMIK